VSVTSSRRQAAVDRRDERADGTFVFAVRTTGIYCRPACPARRPRPENVAFYDDPDAAESAGYRACKRCHPRETWARRPGPPWVWEACRLLSEPGGEAATLGRLAARFGVSPYHLQRTFTRYVGISPRRYAATRRRTALQQKLAQGGEVMDAILDAGYGSPTPAYADSRRLAAPLGVLRRGAPGAVIRYALADTALGRALVAATERGLAAVALADDDAELLSTLRARYPRAVLERDDAALHRQVAAVKRAVKGTSLDLPLDVHGTVFQSRVWEALKRIPAGETRTYAQVAQSIGQPGATRAVARACATNPVALAVPCHRVVPSAGGTGGYRWGAERKEALLSAERSAARRR
jgi:AraC family transcriptional regulator of adaptative response/methylated-DNA-[protein]-cysteine methyltransferase